MNLIVNVNLNMGVSVSVDIDLSVNLDLTLRLYLLLHLRSSLPSCLYLRALAAFIGFVSELALDLASDFESEPP